MKRGGKLNPSRFFFAPKQRHGVADKEDLAGTRAHSQAGGELLALGFVVGEPDFDQSVVGESLIERGDDGVGYTLVSDVDDGFEFL